MMQNQPGYPDTKEKKERSVFWLYLAGFLWLMVPVAIVVALFTQGVISSPFGGFTSNKYTSQQVVDAFKGAGLEVAQLRPYNPGFATATTAPFQYVDGFNFNLPTVSTGAAGSVTSFQSSGEMDKAKAWVADLGKNGGIFSFRTYQRDNILVAISSSVPEATAKQYETVLTGLK